MIRRADRRRLGLGLFAFGATGIALILAALVLVLGSLAAVGDVASGLERQRTELVAMIGPASAALEDAATSASNASGSLTQAGSAADRAADLTTRLADSFEGLGALGTFEIFGTRPFAGLDQQFASVAADARSLSADLKSTATSLRSNVADSQAVAADLQALAGQLDRLETSLGGSPTPGSSAQDLRLPILAAELVVLGLLGWMAVPAIAACWLGWRLGRRTRS